MSNTDTNKPLVKLEDWKLVNCPDGQRRLTGYTIGHPHIPDNQPMHTTRVVRYYPNLKLAITRHTRYKLGTPAK